MANVKPNVLFVCDGPADRAQMAEALLRDVSGNTFEIYSAGIESPPTSHQTIKVIEELGIPFNSQSTFELNDFEELQFDYVIAICDQVDNLCLRFPKDKQINHWQLNDPQDDQNSVEQTLENFRQARDALAVRITAWLKEFRSKK